MYKYIYILFEFLVFIKITSAEVFPALYTLTCICYRVKRHEDLMINCENGAKSAADQKKLQNSMFRELALL